MIGLPELNRALFKQFFRQTLCLIACAPLVACGKQDGFVTGPKRLFDAGPTGFMVVPIAFNGRSLGFADAHPPPQRFGSGYWVYRACYEVHGFPGHTGDCKDWHSLDVTTGSVAPIRLPGLIPDVSFPAFRWPHVAYVQVAKVSGDSWRTVHCVVWDFQTGKMIKRQQTRVPETAFGTDVGGIFVQPVFSGEGNQTTVEFKAPADDDKKSQRLCKLTLR